MKKAVLTGINENLPTQPRVDGSLQIPNDTEGCRRVTAAATLWSWLSLLFYSIPGVDKLQGRRFRRTKQIEKWWEIFKNLHCDAIYQEWYYLTPWKENWHLSSVLLARFPGNHPGQLVFCWSFLCFLALWNLSEWHLQTHSKKRIAKTHEKWRVTHASRTRVRRYPPCFIR